MLHSDQGATSVVHVEPLSATEAAERYPANWKPVRSTREMKLQEIFGRHPEKLLGVAYDEHVILEGRDGAGVIITEENAKTLIREWFRITRCTVPDSAGMSIGREFCH